MQRYATHINGKANSAEKTNSGLFFQPKLTINQPNDIYEQAADTMADKVMRMSAGGDLQQSFFKPAITPLQRKCAACEKEEKIQRKASVPDIQKDDDDKPKEGIEFKPFPTGVAGRWPGFGFNLDITNAQLDFGNPLNKQLSLGLNYPGEPYAALTLNKDFAFKLGYDFAENNLRAGGRYKGFSYGILAGLENPAFGLGLGYGHFPLFNYNMRSAFQFGNTPLPYDFMYGNELNRTQAAIGNWQQGGATDPERFFSVVGEAGNFTSMTGDMYDVADKPKYNWGAGINVGYDPQMQWYFMAGLKFYLGKQEQRKTPVSPKLAGNSNTSNLQLKEASRENTVAETSFENYVNNLSASGSPLSKSAREFYEPRFGYDFSNVKIHTDSVAAQSAQSINALAYTSGNNIVFNTNQYAPETDSGKRLLAHELTHIIQQGPGVKRKIIQKVPCLAGAVCTLNTATPGEFSSDEEAAEAPARAAIAAAPPAAVTASGHGRRAVNIEAIVNSYRGTYEFPAAPSILGIFVDNALSEDTGAMITDCALFAASVPGLACGTKTHLIVTHSEIETQAATYLTAPSGTVIPLGPASWGTSFVRSNWLIELLRMMRHETQHRVFDAAVDAGAVANAGACTMTTILPSGENVAFDLSEISSILSDIQVIEKGFRRGRLSAAMHTNELNSFRDFVNAVSGESVIGAIKDIKCKCNCADANQLLINAFNFTTSGWSRDDKRNLNALLQTELGALWPVFVP